MLKKAVLIPAGALASIMIYVPVMAFQVSRLRLYNPHGWQTARGIGSPDADFLTRAIIAKIGIFANSPDKALYLRAMTGPPLPLHKAVLRPRSDRFQGGRHYRVKGHVDMPAAWWSITLYDANDYLFANVEDRSSFTNFNLETDERGRFVLDVASTRPDGATNWLPAPTSGPYTVILRLYEPQVEIFDHIESYPFPDVVEVIS